VCKVRLGSPCSSKLSAPKALLARVVILGVRRLSGRRASSLVHYVLYKTSILDIFYECSFKIPQIYSNMLEYARIFLCRVGMKVY
jgi:hypothetical protein